MRIHRSSFNRRSTVLSIASAWLVMDLVVVLLVGCQSSPSNQVVTPSIPRLSQAPLHTKPASGKTSPPVTQWAALSYVQMKRSIRKGMTDAQVRAALGSPQEDVGATMLDEERKYGDTLRKLSYGAHDGIIIIDLVKGRVV